MLVLTGSEILKSLGGQEHDILNVVRQAYLIHHRGETALPFSSFLHLPTQAKGRIIALPAYLGEEFGLAGIKWISSFPTNLERGLNRASAAMILNDTETGFPVAMIEGSVVSAKRTAASAALAAQTLLTGRPDRLTLVGCGLIQFEIARFLKLVLGELPALSLFDLSAARLEHFRKLLDEQLSPAGDVRLARSLEESLEGADLVSFATTASVPYVPSLDNTASRAVILHVSLRDLNPQTILAADNLTDDIDHVLRERTSLDLTRQQVGHQNFLRGTLGEVLAGAQPARTPAEGRIIFSPFGLGILDLAVGKVAISSAKRQVLGLEIADFAPPSWG